MNRQDRKLLQQLTRRRFPWSVVVLALVVAILLASPAAASAASEALAGLIEFFKANLQGLIEFFKVL